MISIHDLIRCRKIISSGGLAEIAFGDGTKSARYLRDKMKFKRELTVQESVAISRALQELGITIEHREPEQEKPENT